jgi:peptidoglycan-associated lipoprotein
MRVSAPLTLLLCSLLSACATNLDALINKEIEQSGPLKVHPGLVEKPGPGRAAAAARPSPAPAVAAEDAKATPVDQAPTDSR